MRSPLLAAGALLNVLTIPPLIWLDRVAPHAETCVPAPTAERMTWTAGLGPVAFAAGCATVLVLLRASSLGGTRAPRTADLAGGALAVALGAQWWAAGEDGIAVWLAFLSVFTVYPLAVVVPGFYGWLLWAAHKGRPVLAWQLLRALCWCTLVVLIPFFVAMVDGQGDGGLCMSATALPMLAGG